MTLYERLAATDYGREALAVERLKHDIINMVYAALDDSNEKSLDLYELCRRLDRDKLSFKDLARLMYLMGFEVTVGYQPFGTARKQHLERCEQIRLTNDDPVRVHHELREQHPDDLGLYTGSVDPLPQEDKNWRPEDYDG